MSTDETITPPEFERFIFDCEYLLLFCTSFEKSDIRDQTDSVLESKLDDLENRWKKLQTSYENLMLLANTEEIKPVKENASKNLTATSETYYTCKAHIIDLLKLSKACDIQNNTSNWSVCPQTLSARRSTFVKLPTCDIDEFKGTYEEWPSFRELFTSLYINNRDIPNAQKLFYLRNKTSGSAGAIVKRYSLCDENFDLAWSTLKARYENKRVLVDNQLKLLFNLPVATAENSEAIQKIHSTVNDCLTSLKTLNVQVEALDPILIYLISTKLPDQTLALWEQSLDSHRELPQWSQMDEFLTNRCEVVERLTTMKATKTRYSIASTSNLSFQSYSSQEKFDVYCPLCSEEHPLRKCPQFRKYTVQSRRDYVFQTKLCNNCLSSSHTKPKCPSKYTCFICHKDHHSLLHLPQPQNHSTGYVKPESNFQNSRSNPTKNETHNKLPKDFLNVTPSTSKAADKSQVQANFSSINDCILLRTALVQIDHCGELFTVRALIDPGSQKTFVSERLKKMLQIPTQRSHVEIIGIGGQVQSATEECDLVLFSKRCNIKFTVKAIILPKLTRYIPSTSFEVPSSSEIAKLDLADPNFSHSSKIDLILGNDCERYINIDGIKKNVCGQASAYNTIFGWVLSGPVKTQTVNSFTTSVHPNDNSNISDILRTFWEQEETPSSRVISSEDQYCENFYTQTTTRQEDGRYVVRLPFRKEFPNTLFLGSSRNLAFGQYNRMKQTLAKDPELQKQYNSVLEEYLSLDHMEKTSFREKVFNEKYFSFYLPHHAVVRPEHKTTKMRVVFNASRNTKSGYSLNDVLYTGPTLQRDLMTIILNWRKYRFVFSGDIQKMYRQILVHPEDRPFPRIIYQDESNGAFTDFQLKTVTFGVNSAPFLAIRTLLQLASDSEPRFPKAASILRNEIYVDDILSGGHTIEDALESQKQIIATLNSAGFPLKKISANNPELLSQIPEDDLYDCNLLRFQESSSTKTLGIKWNALTDTFSYSFTPISQTHSVTKRQILSAVAKLFDPAGWITPIIVRAKMLMQQLWLEGTDWDEKVSADSLQKWNSLISDLPFVETISISRWLQYDPSDQVQIHGFSDSSKAAYCATVYLRCRTNSAVVFANLLVSKSKVAPIQPVCLPRLELNGAVLLAKLVAFVLDALNFKDFEPILWTDSSIVLGWLSKPPWSWETYVANRTAQIHQLLPKATWRHVPTHDNPADLGTRGCKSQDLKNNLLWWQGPPWLTKPPSEWPKRNPLNSSEIEKKVHALQASVSDSDILNLFSLYDKSLRILAYAFRFLRKGLAKYRSDFVYSTSNLTQKEVNFVKTRLLMLAQKSYYASEYSALSNSKELSDKSALKPLNPKLDENGILRAYGRLSNSSIPFNERCPKILPGNSRLCELYLSYLHLSLAHGECNQMCRMVQTEFYVSRLKVRIKKIIRHCKNCIIFKKQSCSQIMAPLPPERCSLSVPFQTTGIDFAGPFELKASHARKSPYIKGYVSVFVCFSRKAIHLEACSDLSTAAFRAAFARFVGRRGLPHRIVSDNGRNFLGASRELSREFASFIKSSSEELTHIYIAQGFEWRFIPPYAPHMGGLWEAAVKSFKFHLKRIAGSNKFTFEEFTTVLARIEGVLNSRPISALSEDPNDLTALTPGHFLRGAPILAPPEPTSEKFSLLNRWERLKSIHHQFSVRWKEDYLKSLHKRYKWKSSTPNLQPGDLVVIIDDLKPPCDWRLGRIEKTHIGIDSNTRSAEVRTSSGIIIRPIVKLVYLPLLSDSEHRSAN